jgi:ATP-dependent RNA helicase DDX19/DBP5
MADSGAAKPLGSLTDRISQPSATLNATTANFTPSTAPTKTSWADEVASPTEANATNQMNTFSDSQVDGSVEPLGGSSLHDGEFDVEVKLSDMQSDVHNPLYSVNTFEALGM